MKTAIRSLAFAAVFALSVLLALPGHAFLGQETLLSGATTVSTGSGFRTPTGPAARKTFQAWGSTTNGVGAATILVQGSNNAGVTWDTIGTIPLTLTTSMSSDSFTSDDRYIQVRGNVTGISGTGAAVSLVMGL